MADELLQERLAAQLLTGPPSTAVEDVVERILAVQAQDPRGARLAIRSRSTGLSSADVDRALNDRSLVITTLNRGTLHLVHRDDYWWLHQLTTPQLAPGNARRLRQEQVSPAAAERGVATIERTIADNGPQTRDQLREAIAAAGVRTEGQAFIHLVLAASLEGLIVRGPMIGTHHAFVLVRDWLGKPPRFDREPALGELARRYLAGHGPASDADLARWAGITVGDARRGLGQIGTDLADRDDGQAALRAATQPAGLPPPRLLGSFEPCLLGWVSRSQITGRHQGLVTTNGLFRPFAMVGGKSVATWTLTGSKLELTPLATISRVNRAELASDANAVPAFLGLESVPIQLN